MQYDNNIGSSVAPLADDLMYQGPTKDPFLTIILLT